MSELKITRWPENERPRERLIKYGAGQLSDAQLLAIILRTGSGGKSVLDLSLDLLDEFKSLRGIDAASAVELASKKGLGTAKIAQVKAAFELGKRLITFQRGGAGVEKISQVNRALPLVRKHGGVVNGHKLQMRHHEFGVSVKRAIKELDGLAGLAAHQG